MGSGSSLSVAAVETFTLQSLKKNRVNSQSAAIFFEVVSKPQIRFKGKAQADRESAAYVEYVSIYREACNTAIEPQMGF